MTTIARISLIFVLALVALAALVWSRSGADDDPLTAAVARELDREVSLEVGFERTVARWRLVCGTVRSPDGTALPPEAMDALDGMESDGFCALLDLEDGTAVRELDVGSTDMPAIDWMETYSLPPELLSDP